MCENCNCNLLKRIEQLEKIVNPHSLSLISRENPNKVYVMDFESGQIPKTGTYETESVTNYFPITHNSTEFNNENPL